MLPGDASEELRRFQFASLCPPPSSSWDISASSTLADVADNVLLNGVHALAPTLDEKEDGLMEIVPDKRCSRLAIGTFPSSSSLSPTI